MTNPDQARSGIYGPDNFDVFAKGGSGGQGTPAPAKYLADSNGNYVIDPLTNYPYVVTAHRTTLRDNDCMLTLTKKTLFW